MIIDHIPDQALDITAEVGTHVCLLDRPHYPHRWVYTSEGGGHMVHAQDAHPTRDRDWFCPGVPLTMPVGPGVLTMSSGEKAETTGGTATLLPLDGRGDVERIIAKLREPEPPPLRVKVKVAGPALFAQGRTRLYLRSDRGVDATCSQCGPLDTLKCQYVDLVIDVVVRTHLEGVHGLTGGVTR